MARQAADMIQHITDATGKELSAAEIRAAFDREYAATASPIAFVDHRAQHNATGAVERMVAKLAFNGEEVDLVGAGNGPVDAFVQALREGAGFDIHVQNYHEHGVGSGEDATAVAYVQLRIGSDRTVYGVGFDGNIVTATLRAVVCAANRALQRGWLTLQPAKRAVHA